MKDIRIILTKGNSVWGVIAKVVSSNVYENVISFTDNYGHYNESLKHEFVGDNLFQGDQNWKSLFDKEETKTREITLESDINLSYRYKIKDQDEKLEMMNKDTLVLRYTDNGGDYKYLFYAINDVTNINHDVIEFTAELDIMFSHFDTLDWKGQSAIVRGHTDRYNSKGFIMKDNILHEETLSFMEPVKTEYQAVMIPEKYFDSEMGNFEKQAVNNNLKWGVVYEALKEGETGTVLLENEDIELPFRIHIFPIYNDYTVSGILAQFNDASKTFGVKTYKEFRDKPETLAIHVTNGIPWPFNNSTFTNVEKFIRLGLDGMLYFYFDQDSTDTTGNLEWDETTQSIKVNVINPDDYSFKLTTEIYPDTINKYTNLVDKPNPVTYNDKKEIRNEVKLYLSQFTKFIFNSPDGQGDEINRQYEIEDEIQLKYMFGFSPEKLTEFYYTEKFEYDEEKFLLRDNLAEKRGLVKVSNSELAINSDPYKEYIATHRTTSKSGYLGGGIQNTIKGAAAGALAGSTIMPGMGTVGGALVGAGGGIVQSMFNSVNFEMEMLDLRKAPNTPSHISSTISLNLASKQGDKIIKKVLPEDYKLRAYDYLYAMGYNIRKLDKIENWLNTRYYFNYIQTGSVFSNIGLNLSAKQKQIISDSMQNGITIWHYRDKNTFKGILNYEYENQEMTLVKED